MEHNIIWTPWDNQGSEHLHLSQTDQAVTAEGMIVGMQNATAFTLHYSLHCDVNWHVRSLTLKFMYGATTQHLSLHANGKGRWHTPTGELIPALEGCIDIDISATPFTNTLPIRRLALNPGEAAELLVAYISIPDVIVQPVWQRYTCLEQRPDGSRYRYEDLSTGYTNEIEVDADALVLDYPGLFRRVR